MTPEMALDGRDLSMINDPVVRKFRGDAQWKVHMARLFEEIVKGSGQSIYLRPIQITAALMVGVGECAARLNDPQLNALMCRLTIYTIADPESLDYDPERLKEIYEMAGNLA